MFVTFEGIEGSGKTTQIRSVEAWFQMKKKVCLSTREPGGTAVGKKIRSLLLDRSLTEIVPEAELLLYMADRLQHVRTIIQPSLDAGKVVLCDRFFDATLAYQGYGRGLDMDFIQKLYHLTCFSLEPDLTFVLDLPPEEGLKRAWKAIQSGDRNDNETRFEEEAITFHQKVRKGYLDLCLKNPHRMKVIDATGDPLEVKDQILEEIKRRFTV